MTERSSKSNTPLRPQFTLRSLILVVCVSAVLLGFWVAGLRTLTMELLGCIVGFGGGTAAGWWRVRRGKAELLAYLAPVLCLIGIAIPLSHVFLHRDPLVQAILPGAAFLSLGLGIMHGMHRGVQGDRPWLRFNWMSALVGSAMGSVLITWIALRWWEHQTEIRAERERAALSAAGIRYSWDRPLSVSVGPVRLFVYSTIKIFPELRHITDSDLEHLADLISVRSINLSGTQITDDGLKHLRRLAMLETLDLSGTQVTDAGLEHLKGLTGLRHLGLKNTATTEAGANELRQALPRLTNISR